MNHDRIVHAFLSTRHTDNSIIHYLFYLSLRKQMSLVINSATKKTCIYWCVPNFSTVLYTQIFFQSINTNQTLRVIQLSKRDKFGHFSGSTGDFPCHRNIQGIGQRLLTQGFSSGKSRAVHCPPWQQNESIQSLEQMDSCRRERDESAHIVAPVHQLTSTIKNKSMHYQVREKKVICVRKKEKKTSN